jgi:hypothetical protein
LAIGIAARSVGRATIALWAIHRLLARQTGTALVFVVGYAIGIAAISLIRFVARGHRKGDTRAERYSDDGSYDTMFHCKVLLS